MVKKVLLSDFGLVKKQQKPREKPAAVSNKVEQDILKYKKMKELKKRASTKRYFKEEAI